MIDDMNKYTKGVRERQAELDVKQVAEEMNEPTLTCSEIVERLAKECFYEFDDKGNPRFNREYAETILHSWRERRVQELENLLAKHSGCSHCADSASRITSTNDSTEIRESK